MPYPLNSSGCSLWNTLDPAVNFKLRLSLVRHGLSVLVPCWWEFLRISFRTVLSRRRGDKETFWRRISSVFLFTTFNTVGWHCVIRENGIGSGLPDFQSFILSLSQSDPIYGTPEHIPLGIVLYLSWILRIGHGIHSGVEYFLSSFSCISHPASNPERKMECIQRVIKGTHSTCTEFIRYPTIMEQICFLQSDLGWHACSGWNRRKSDNYAICSCHFLYTEDLTIPNSSISVRSRCRDTADATVYPNPLLHHLLDENLDVVVSGSVSSRLCMTRISLLT